MHQHDIDYARIAAAINFIKDHLQDQPSLDEIATAVELSPFHFQKLFTEWAGVSPKKFMQYLTLEYAKSLLRNADATLLDTAHATGLSGTSRLHDLFISLEGMTPGEFKNGGTGLQINYHFAESPFGQLIVASTHKGICHLFFVTDKQQAIDNLIARFPKASFKNTTDKLQQDALSFFQKDWHQPDKIKLHLSGTPFQLKVWESLLKVPMGALVTYGTIAKNIDKPSATRAVGTAIGSNPIAFLIPCHRVIQNTGRLGGYMWGETRKSAIIGWEAAQKNS
ncbi:methylated-DNA--[protein]-cysteine S-methyltransferase [Cellvibrio sp. QJXJ]|jgi:AraC family transcriptional regulator of adaptative response/methylated-DNA-[protein]-cysteine methyltransferase|uniref:methylated-DNA--[protein]-cysteine S-methyltransferase n=1 Tax=Cellvibrio sp. QJXJ TaxID=2964606 RepID=UPI0021C3C52D|nr:methylated-DNA--[protein]-cysteine S-methyltransferase [Cellvibrio sp. QJXJ]UUA74834.1 methylated-DNA--[protein]-cysteine S-methyltransferase [Cellvibrio sp. QJXJ]